MIITKCFLMQKRGQFGRILRIFVESISTNNGRRMNMEIILRNEQGVVKYTKLGFSWTTLLFGFFPALFRGDLKWAATMFLAASVTYGLTLLIFPFIYNRIYIKELIDNGYEAVGGNSQKVLTEKGLLLND